MKDGEAHIARRAVAKKRTGGNDGGRDGGKEERRKTGSGQRDGKKKRQRRRPEREKEKGQQGLELVEVVQGVKQAARGKRKGRKGENEDERRRRRKKGWKVRRMEKRLFLGLVVVRNFGVVSAASDNVQDRKGKLEETLWKRELVRNSCAAEEDRGKFQKWEDAKNRSEMQKPSKTVRY